MHFDNVLGANWICFPGPFRAVQIRVKATIAKNQVSTLMEAENERYAI